ncbi:MAG TPA: hypothetical protein VGM90_07580 [Kofleriaceae bacterium]|jgi:hypothetical protein
MTAHRIALSLLVAAALPACTDDTGSSPPDDIPSGPVACKQNEANNDEILACGFGPKLALLGVDSGRIYAVSEPGTFFSIDRASGTTTRLYHSQFQQSLQARKRGTVIRDGHILFPSNFDDGATISAGVLSIAGDVAQDDATVLMRGDRFEPEPTMIDSGSLLYASSIEHGDDFSTFSGRVISISYDGNHVAPVTPDYGMPIGLRSGYLYYLHDHDAKRVPLAGGAAETVVASIAFSAWANDAVGDSYLYGSSDAAPYDLVGFPIMGGAPIPLAALTSNAEIPESPAHDLHIDGNWLYFMRSAGVDDTNSAWTSLWRIRLDGSGQPEFVAVGQEMLAPLFDENFIYLAYNRGGYDTPLEGVISRIAKPPMGVCKHC